MIEFKYLKPTETTLDIKELILEIIDSDFIWEHISDLISDDELYSISEDFNLKDIEDKDELVNVIIDVLKKAVEQYDK